MPLWLQKTLYFLLKTLLIIAGLFLCFKLLRYMAPFILAFLLSAALEPVIRFLEKKVHLPRKIGAVFSILIVLGTIGTLLTGIAMRLVKEISNLYEAVSTSFGDLTIFFNRMMDEANRFYIQLPTEVTDAIDSTVSALGTSLKDVLGSMAQTTLKITVSVPEAVIFLLVSILATYFMISDRVHINAAFERWVPKTWLRNTRGMIFDVFKALFGWLRAQGIIMSVTFTILITGLLVAGVENPLVIALLTAIIDALPVFGAGAVLIPWSIAAFIVGNIRLGVFLLLLDVVILVVRHLIEPRIVGRQIGIHPLLTLLGMYLGLQWIGVFGMIAGPIFIVILRAILEGLMKTERIAGFMRRLSREEEALDGKGDKSGSSAEAGDKSGSSAEAGDETGPTAEAGDETGPTAEAGDAFGASTNIEDMTDSSIDEKITKN